MIEPYIGLRSFGPRDAQIFFGRERIVEDLISKLGEARFVSVIGASGAGKSSIVRAGLRPALEAGFLDWKGGAWDVVEFRPGGDPIGRLAGALAASDWSKKAAADANGWKKLLSDTPLGLQRAIDNLPRERNEQLLIVVDQFEETFRLPREEGTAAEDKAPKEAIAARRRQTRTFIDLLLAAANSEAPVYVVVTMRSDFLGECAEYPLLAEAVNRGLFLVSNMTEEELRDAICMPALIMGKRVHPALADALIDEIQGEQFQLPMLQHFLMQAWRDGNGNIETDKWLLQEKAERDSDHKGPKTKLKKTPAEVLDSDLNMALSGLTSDQKLHAQRLFKRITTQRDGKGTRDPTRLQQVADFAGTTPVEMKKVIDVFRQKDRCFVEPLTGVLDDETAIDITHEAVIYSWGELKRWINEEAEHARALEDVWRKSRSGKSLTREEMEDGRRLFDFAPWAERYASLYQDRYGGELNSVRKFLEDSMEDEDRRELQRALQEGRVWDVDSLTKRGVRLTTKQLEEFRFQAHYYALLPDELFATDKGGAGSPGETEDGLRQRRKRRMTEVFSGVVSRKTDRGHSVAHFAARGGSIEILDHLASIFAPLNDENERGSTPFFWAVEENKRSSAEWLLGKLDKDATIGKVSDVTGRTALHAAAKGENSSADMIVWLLEQGADANAKDIFGITPLHEAAGEGDLARVEALLTNAANPDNRADAAHAGEDGLTPLMALFVYTPYNEDRRSNPRQPVLDMLLRNGAEKSMSSSYRGSSTLHLAIEASDPADELAEVVETLLEKGASVEARDWSGKTPVETALDRGLTDIAVQMAQRTPSRRELWADWLIAAIDVNNEEALYELLSISTDGVSLRGRRGLTPLHSASRAAEPWMLYALLDEEPELEVENFSGDTPLRYAMRYGRGDAVKVLTDAGASPPKLVAFDWEKEAPVVLGREALVAHLRASLSQPETHWPFGMILSGDWRDCNVDEAIQRLLPLYVEPQFAISTFAESFRAVRRLPLASIADAELCQVLTIQGERVSYYTFISRGGGHVELGGDFRWFERVQKDGSLRLGDPASVGELIRLTYASWQRDGICIVLDDPDRSFLAGGVGDAPTRALVVGEIAAAPFHIEPQVINGRWRGSCALKYQDAIIRSEFSVDAKNGGILHDLRTIVEGLPLSKENLARGFYTSRI